MNQAIPQSRYDTSTDTRIGRDRRSIVAWIGLVLLAFNIFIAGTLPARDAAAAPAPFAQALMGDRIVICTAASIIVIDSSGNIVDTTTTDAEHSDICVFCLPLMHGGIQTPAAVTVTVRGLFPSDDAFLPSSSPSLRHPARLAGAAAPRAPPRA